jgi:hypothetical protein
MLPAEGSKEVLRISTETPVMGSVVGEGVGVGVGVGATVGVGVALRVGVGVADGVEVTVGVGLAVGVAAPPPMQPARETVAARAMKLVTVARRRVVRAMPPIIWTAGPPAR